VKYRNTGIVKYRNTGIFSLKAWKQRPVMIFVNALWAKAATSRRINPQGGRKLYLHTGTFPS